jgi:hypothetical protein
LKGIITDCRVLLDESGGTPMTHSLRDLWDTAKPLLIRVEPGSDGQAIRNVGASLRRFHDLDPTSQETRYPVDRNGQPTLAGLRHVNLRQVREVVDRLGAFLEAVEMALSVYLEYKAEALAEYAQSGAVVGHPS